MDSTDIVIIIVWTLIIYGVCRYIKYRSYHKSDVKYFRIYSGVHDLAQIVNQLQELEELQTQIELARFHHLKGVTIQLPDNLSHDHSHTLLINGHDRNSRALMHLVLSERDRLRETLTKKIHELDKHGTTQLRPDLAMKEAVECSTMRVRGAHFSPIETTPPAQLQNIDECTVHNKTDEFNVYFSGGVDDQEGEEDDE